MIQDHRITAPTKPGAATPMTERPEWTHVSVGNSPTIIDLIEFHCHYYVGWGGPCFLVGAVLTVPTLTRGASLPFCRLRRWYAEGDPLAFAKVKALRRRGADSV